MESSNFGTASLQPAGASLGEDEVSVRALAALDPSGSNLRLLTAIFFALLALHVALLLRLQTDHSTHFVLRKPSQVEIQITRPPPPPKPVVVPPQDNHPPPVKPASPRQPRIVPPEPVHAAPVAGGDAPAIEAPPPPAEEGPVGPGEAAAPVQAAAPPPPPPAPVVAAKEGANYLKNPRPAYPRLAMREGWEGSVLLRVRVLPNGRPAEITVQKSSGRGVLDDAATETVKSWTFMPATQAGNPIAGWVNVPIEFRLQ